MCIIAFCKAHKLTTEQMVNCWNNNADGAGVAWVEDGKVHVHKGFMDLDSFARFYETLPTIPHVVHFRVGTSGGNVPGLTHPFLVSTESPLKAEYVGTTPVLFHNGIVSSWREMSRQYYVRTLEKVPEGPFSDTRALAVILNTIGLNALSFIDGKYVVVSPKGFEVYGDGFVEEDGILFSNGTFRYSSSYKKGSAKETKEKDVWKIGPISFIDKDGHVFEQEEEEFTTEELNAQLKAAEDKWRAEDYKRDVAAAARNDDRTALAVRSSIAPKTQVNVPVDRKKIDVHELLDDDSLDDMFAGCF